LRFSIWREYISSPRHGRVQRGARVELRIFSVSIIDDGGVIANTQLIAVPLQSRVLPTGEIVAIPERGTRMGNRGRIHVAR
jgi:hypothetical protein